MKRLVVIVVVFTVFSEAEIVRFKADRLTYKMSEPRQVICSGNAEVRAGTNVIKANKIIISGKNLDEALCTGGVVIKDLETGTMLLSEKVEYYQEKDYIRLMMEPVLISKNVKISSGEMERYNSLRESSIKGHSVIEKSNVTVRCFFGKYEESLNIARLRGPVEILHSGASGATNIIFCNEMVLFTDEERMILGGRLSGKVWFNE